MVFLKKHLFKVIVSVSLCTPTALKAEEHGGAKASPFVTFPTFLVPVIQNRELATVYAIDLVVEASSAHIINELNLYFPRLNDALFTDMYGVFGLVWSSDTRVLLKDLKTRLLGVAQRVAGQERVKDVLIQSFQEQKAKIPAKT